MEPTALPERARRLFPHYEESALHGEAAAVLLIPRLLEDGDGDDLAWLAATYGEAALAGWLERRGARQLSVRSRAFWELVLGRPAAPGSGGGNQTPMPEDSGRRWGGSGRPA